MIHGLRLQFPEQLEVIGPCRERGEDVRTLLSLRYAVSVPILRAIEDLLPDRVTLPHAGGRSAELVLGGPRGVM